MRTVRAVTDESFEAEVLRNPKPVIVECWAQWCGLCRQVAPVLGAIAAEHADKIDVVKLNVDENPETAQKYAIDRKSTRLNSSHLGISYAVFCLKKKKQ